VLFIFIIYYLVFIIFIVYLFIHLFMNWVECRFRVPVLSIQLLSKPQGCRAGARAPVDGARPLEPGDADGRQAAPGLGGRRGQVEAAARLAHAQAAGVLTGSTG
jgi:hypothetical protein